MRHSCSGWNIAEGTICSRDAVRTRSHYTRGPLPIPPYDRRGSYPIGGYTSDGLVVRIPLRNSLPPLSASPETQAFEFFSQQHLYFHPQAQSQNMYQGYYSREGMISQEKVWLKVLRGRTQFIITVHPVRISNTHFGETLLRQIERSQEHSYNNPSDMICLYCFPLLERLAPQTSVQGLTLDDFARSPMYHLEIVDAGNDRDVRIEGEAESVYAPSYNISPIATSDLPETCKALPRVHGSDLTIAPSEEDSNPLRSVQGRVTTAEGDVMYFKPRTDGREMEFEREVRILCRIEEANLRRGEVRLPELKGIVMSGEKDELAIGMLMNFIASPEMGMHLLSRGFWGQHELHKKWEEQVVATVKELHAHDIVWGDVNPCNVAIDEALDAWIIDFGGMNNPEFVDDNKAETMEGDWQGVGRLFEKWLPSRVA